MKDRKKVRYSILLITWLVLPALVASESDFFFSESRLVPVLTNNFNVNMDDWRVWGFNQSADPIVSTEGNFSIIDDTLRAYDDEWNVAQHNSTVAYGSWSFDIDLVRTPRNHCLVAFASGWEDTPAPGQELIIDPSYSYGIIFATGEFGPQNTSFVLFRRNAGNPAVVPMATYNPDDDVESTGWYEGWYHFDITRNSRGDFAVYINNTLKMQATDTSFATSDVFYIHAEADIALDNVWIDTGIVIDHIDPEFVEAEDQEYYEGDPVAYQMEAYDSSGIISWGTNDTAYFHVNEAGLLTNSSTVTVGSYPLIITVFDNGLPAFNTNTKVITITILEAEPTNGEPVDMTLLLVVGGGIGVVVILVAVVKLKK